MLPDSKRRVAEFAELVVGVAVPRPIPANFVQPEVGSGLRNYEVGVTAVPEAAVDEDIEPDPAEDDVGSATPVEWQLDVNPVPQSSPMK